MQANKLTAAIMKDYQAAYTAVLGKPQFVDSRGAGWVCPWQPDCFLVAVPTGDCYVSDGSHTVPAGSLLDAFARSKGQTINDANRTVMERSVAALIGA